MISSLNVKIFVFLHKYIQTISTFQTKVLNKLCEIDCVAYDFEHQTKNNNKNILIEKFVRKNLKKLENFFIQKILATEASAQHQNALAN